MASGGPFCGPPKTRSVVDPWALGSDISQNVTSVALAPVLWAFLYLFAFEDRALARTAGFGRSTFLLLIAGGLLGSLGALPFFAFQGNVLAIDLGGGAIPTGVALWLVRRTFGDAARTTALFLGGFAAQSGGAFMVVMVARDAAPLLVGLAVVAAAPGALLYLYSRSAAATDALTFRRVAILLGLTAVALFGTFVTSTTVPGLGIESSFPGYLFAPVIVGATSVLLARPAFRLPMWSGLPIAFSAGTLGVLIGADLLRQPPLYETTGKIYAIGGAGLFDLVALTGPLALAAAYFVYRERLAHARGSPGLPEDASREPTGTPFGELRSALMIGIDGREAASLAASSLATHAAAAQARRLLEVPSRPALGRWSNLPVPSWVAADQENLDRLAASPRIAPGDAYRGWMTARWLVRAGAEAGRPRYATVARRAVAFLLDLALLAVPAIVAYAALVSVSPGTPFELAQGLWFNVIALGFPAVGFLYFALLGAGTGATVGKRLVGITVRDREMRPPDLLRTSIRELPKLVPLTVLTLGIAFLLATLLHGASPVVGGPVDLSLGAWNALPYVLFLFLGIGVPGAVSALTISRSSESQRLGDYWAGTWVVTRSAPPVAWAVGPSGVAPAASST